MHRIVLIAVSFLIAASSLAQSGTADRFQPKTGLGLFDVELAGDTLKIKLKVKYHFEEGLKSEVLGFESDEYEWDSAAEDQFKRRFEKTVESTWSRKYALQSPTGTAEVHVEVEVEESSQPHWHIEARHYPPDAPDSGAFVCGPKAYSALGSCFGNEDPKIDDTGTLVVARTHEVPINVQDLDIGPVQFWFDSGQSTTAENFARPTVELLKRPEWFGELRGFAAPNEVRVMDRSGQSPIELSRDRVRKAYEAIEDVVCSGHPNVSTCRQDLSKRLRIFAQGLNSDRSFAGKNLVELSVFRNEQIDTLAHEAGHLLGLGDEAADADFPSGSALPSPEYAAQVLELFGIQIVRHDDDGIMSRGSTVRPWHYVPFLEALRHVSQAHGNWVIAVPPHQAVALPTGVLGLSGTPAPAQPRVACVGSE